MSNILLLLSSPRSESYSTQIARSVVGRLKGDAPGAEVIVRDLARDPLPHVDEDFVEAVRSSTGPKGESQKATVARSDALVDEFLAADTIVIAAPMYNFGIPSTLKAWIDQICRAGRTFRYTEKGPEGLAKGKRAILVLARGGVYSSGPFEAFEYQGTYLRTILAFLGIKDVQTIDVEGLAYGPDAANKAVSAALASIPGMAANTVQ
jgi:FMN-dependent NADH-azoreductase